MSKTKTFTTRLVCHNCGNGSQHEFPFGTKLSKSSIISFPGTTARIPGTSAKRITVYCPHCGSSKIG